MICKSRKILAGGIFVLFLLNGCSSSTYNERYNKPEKTEKINSSKSVRFTSENDNKKNENNDEEKAEIPHIENSDTTLYGDLPQAEFDETPVEDYIINRDEFVKKYSKLKKFDISLTSREKILFEIVNFLETPYKYGGSSANGIDCSSFTQNVYKNSIQIFIPRTAREQFKFGENVVIPEKLNFGDLVFFNTSKRHYPGHVGIYLGDDMFAHASRSLGVTITSMKSSYYIKRYVGARRIVMDINEN